ncbi:uncharacterized protein LOC133744721 [Rosa rugosa]|uniref:uncharacterized protein LOC133744721 n=1 Tax=Rosa rugosa TaxID=74645 RepID=UPI002B409D0D|nr:uncharacterized protein LOC133744721 [Rosa rugosa]
MELFYNSTGKVTRSPARLSSMYSVKCSCWFDIHMNIDKFPLVKYPVLVIHGYVNNLMQGRSNSSQWRSLCKLFSSIGSQYKSSRTGNLWLKTNRYKNLSLIPSMAMKLWLWP